MAIAVDGDLVPLVDDPPGKRRAPRDLLSDQEERRDRTPLRELLEHSRRVPSACGPSSKVIATPRSSSRPQGM